MSILKFTIGRKGASGKHVGYITRDSACEDISFHNLEELEADTDYEKRINALSYAHNREDEEMEKSEKGRTHYRIILSWEDKENTDRAKEQTHKFLDENFEKAKGVVSIHQDTEHTHAHIWLDSRQIDDKKIQIDRSTYKELDERWAKQYDREYGTNRAAEYKEKKEQTRQWKKELRNENRSGKQEKPKNKPERHEDKLDSQFFREKEAKDLGVIRNEESRTGGNQRPFEVRESNSKEAERAIIDSQQQLEKAERNSDRAVEQSDRTESAARGLREEVERVAEKSRKIDDKGEFNR